MNKYMFRYYPCLMAVGLLFTICDVPANAQMDNVLKEGNIISGIVTDDNGPLVNVNVIELDSNGRIVVHVVTDSQGRFSFALNDLTDKLKFTQIPYKEVEIPISEERYEIKMNVDSMHPSLSMVSVNDNPAIQNEILKEFEGLQLTNPVFVLDCYDGFSIKQDADVFPESIGKYTTIDVGWSTPCGDAPVFFVGPTFELKGHGVLIFEDLCWAFERDRENLLLPRQDNYFLDYMLNNCNALTEYTIPNCKGSLLKRLLVKKNFDGSKYVRQVSLKGCANDYLMDTAIITEIPRFRRVEFCNFSKEFVKKIRKEYRNLYGVVVRIRKPDNPAISEIHTMVFVKDKTEIDYVVDWIVCHLVVN